MRSTKTIQSRQVIHSVINKVKVNESVRYVIQSIRQYPSLAVNKTFRYFGLTWNQQE